VEPGIIQSPNELVCYLNKDQSFSGEIIIENYLKSEVEFMLLCVLNNNQISMAIKNEDMFKYNFRVKNGKSISIPYSIGNLQTGKHDLLIVLVKHPFLSEQNPKHQCRTMFGNMMRRLTIIVEEKVKTIKEDFINIGVADANKNLGRYFTINKSLLVDDFDFWTADSLNGAGYITYYIHVNNAFDERYDFILLSFFNYFQIPLIMKNYKTPNFSLMPNQQDVIEAKLTITNKQLNQQNQFILLQIPGSFENLDSKYRKPENIPSIISSVRVAIENTKTSIN
jgi:hypothetical protein